MTLDEGFIQKCRDAFKAFDADGSGTIDAQEMRALLEAIGENPTEEELFKFMVDVDEDGTGEIEFSEFLSAFEKQNSTTPNPVEEQEALDAFISLGGSSDRTGFVDVDKLKYLCNTELGLKISIDNIVKDLDKDGDGALNFQEFSSFLK